VAEHDVGNDAAGNRYEQEFTIVATHPLVATGRFAQVIFVPIIHDVAMVTVFLRDRGTFTVPTLVHATVVLHDIAVLVMANSAIMVFFLLTIMVFFLLITVFVLLERSGGSGGGGHECAKQQG
jgi:hypothetical protein